MHAPCNSGFESFNVKLYKDVARRLSAAVPGVSLEVFSDRDLESRRGEVEAALARADAFFGSLLFDFDQVEWLRPRLERIPVRLVRKMRRIAIRKSLRSPCVA